MQTKLIELGKDKMPTQQKVMGGLKLLSTTVNSRHSMYGVVGIVRCCQLKA